MLYRIAVSTLAGLITSSALARSQAAPGAPRDGETTSQSRRITVSPPEATARAVRGKGSFNLFHPVPDTLMRELNTDRPDATESPFTVDAGHAQVELSFLEYTRTSTPDRSGRDLSLLPANLKIGLLRNVDLQLLLDPYRRLTVRTAGASPDVVSGFGDLELRSKINLWGNDGGSSAGGIMPFVRLPGGTGGEGVHHVEGGLILPLALSLPAAFDLGTMAEFDVDRNASNDGYGLDFVHSVTIGHTLGTPILRGYVEYLGVSPIATGSTYSANLDSGATLTLTRNLQLDGGVNFGLPRTGSSFTLFSGLSARF